MLLRFVVKNFLSFKEATEFNSFPSSKSPHHAHHKVSCGKGVNTLRLSAIYGANGSGKSNLIKAIHLLQGLVVSGNFKEIRFGESLPFLLDQSLSKKPSEFAMEFFQGGQIFYYHLAFFRNEVVSEELFLIDKGGKDKQIFSRAKTIHIDEKFITNGKGFAGVFNRIVKPDTLLLSFLGQNYPEETPKVASAYSWIKNSLRVVIPSYETGKLPHFLATEKMFSKFVNSLMPGLNTGIHRLDVKDEIIDEKDTRLKDATISELIDQAKRKPGQPIIIPVEEIYANFVFEKGKLHLKTLASLHKNSDGSEVEIPLPLESDGTRRMIEYMPMFYSVINGSQVFIVDEIERSIHPILIKNIMQMLSESDKANGQLIFSTHESGLLDQSIFRTDEIWFAQKDIEQATQLYPLSDYDIHNTANIENGYLNGRYGGIPFLSNLKDLHW